MTDYAAQLLNRTHRFLDRAIEQAEMDLADPYLRWGDVDAHREHIVMLKNLRASAKAVRRAGRYGVRLASIPRVSHFGASALDYAATEIFPDNDPRVLTDTMVLF